MDSSFMSKAKSLQSEVFEYVLTYNSEWFQKDAFVFYHLAHPFADMPSGDNLVFQHFCQDDKHRMP